MNIRFKVSLREIRAFTLVETVLAIGIVSFAFVAIMGMLPCGLQVFRKAMDTSMEGQMVQHIVGRISQTPYAEIAQYQGNSFWFDDAGNFVAERSPDCIYSASIAITSQPVLPGSGSAAGGLTGVTITFRRMGEAATGASRTFVTYIAARSRVAAN